jgi:hypothetical protein
VSTVFSLRAHASMTCCGYSFAATPRTDAQFSRKRRASPGRVRPHY